MTCESVKTQLTAYLDGELADDRGSAVRGHLRGCQACRNAAADEAALRDGLRALPPLDPPASLWAGVQAQLAKEEVADAERPAWRRALARWAPRAPQLAFAGVALAAAIVLVAIKLQRDDEPQPIATAPIGTNPVFAPEQAKPAPDVAPVASASSLACAPAGDDVTADLAAEPACVTDQYAATARELLVVAHEARTQWSAERQREFDLKVANLQKKITAAKDQRPRRAAYRSLIRFLQRATVQDDVALASLGGPQ